MAEISLRKRQRIRLIVVIYYDLVYVLSAFSVSEFCTMFWHYCNSTVAASIVESLGLFTELRDRFVFV